MKTDWCGFGAAEYARQTNAVVERIRATNNGLVGAESPIDMANTVGAEVLEESIAQVRQRWVQALMRRGDVRSLALADFIGGPGDEPDAAQARARLQARARTSSDAMVTALALQRACQPGECANIEASQWSRLEPTNLQAWLALLQEPTGAARQTQLDYVLERSATEARYSRTYQREFKEMLLSLPQTETPSLQGEAEINLINGMAASWAVAGWRPLIETCRTNLADTGRASRCEAVAGLMWQQGDQLDRSLAVGIARQLVAARPALRLQWESRAREYEAVNEWMKGAIERVVNRLVPAGEPLASPCLMQPELRNMLRQSAGRPEWERIRAEMKEADRDDEVLAARWRQAAGRSALDPLPPRPASAAKAG